MDIPLANYPSGSRTFVVGAIADSVRGYVLQLAKCTTADPSIWPNASTTLAIFAEMSVDGGETWEYAGGTSASPGGIQVGRLGTGEEPFFTLTCDLRAAPSRQLRVTLEIVDGPLRTSGTVTAI